MTPKALKAARAKDKKRAGQPARREQLRLLNATKNLREHNLRGYGLTPETYNALLQAQDGVCAICHEPPTAMRKGKPDPLCVDHNHFTGENRGLLCRPCNSGIGMLRDSTNLVANALDYLKKYEAVPSKVIPFSKAA